MLKFLTLIWAASAVKISRKNFEEMKTMNLTEEIKTNFLARFDNDGTRYWSSSYNWGSYYSSSYNSSYYNYYNSSNYSSPSSHYYEVCAIDV